MSGDRVVHDRWEWLSEACWQGLLGGPDHPYANCVLLGGPRTGKSAVLSSFALWAAVANWPTIFLPPGQQPPPSLADVEPYPTGGTPPEGVRRLLVVADDLHVRHQRDIAATVADVRSLRAAGWDVRFIGACHPNADDQLEELVGFAEFLPVPERTPAADAL